MQIPFDFSDNLAMTLVDKVQRKVQFSLCAGQERKGKRKVGCGNLHLILEVFFIYLFFVMDNLLSEAYFDTLTLN